MKTKKQVQAFLRTHAFETGSDYNLVVTFCQNQHLLTPKEFPEYTKPGNCKSQDFIEWFEKGFGSGDLVMWEKTGDVVVVVNNDIDTIKTGAARNPKGVWRIETNTHSCNDLEHINPKMEKKFVMDFAKHGWEFDEESQTIKEKFIPAVNNRIQFSNGYNIGLGVVRSIDEESGEMELYCYFWYDTKKMGYSMHEKNVCDLYSFHHSLQTVVATRRMNTELNKKGKLWNDKLHRIEPISGKVAKGEKYWYINDKMKLVQDKERETATSHYRYIAGNYFTNYDDGLNYLSNICEILRDRLAH